MGGPRLSLEPVGPLLKRAAETIVECLSSGVGIQVLHIKKQAYKGK